MLDTGFWALFMELITWTVIVVAEENRSLVTLFVDTQEFSMVFLGAQDHGVWGKIFNIDNVIESV